MNFRVLDMIEWKIKYIELIGNLYVLKEMIDMQCGLNKCDGFSIEVVEVIIEDICLN